MTSLLATREPAPVLFSLPAEVSEELSLAGRYTAERLFREQPEKYQAIVTLLAEKRSVRAIKKACRVHHSTIAAVAEREGVAIDTLKEGIAKDLELAISFGAERLVEVMDTIKPENLPLAVAILIDKWQLLQGGATVRIETIGGAREGGPATFGDWLEQMKRVKGSDTGLGGGEDLQRGAGADSGGGPLAAGDQGEGDRDQGGADRAGGSVGAGDCESVGSQRDSSEATGLAAENDAADGHGGRGGSRLRGGGGPGPTHSGAPNFIPKDTSNP